MIVTTAMKTVEAKRTSSMLKCMKTILRDTLPNDRLNPSAKMSIKKIGCMK